ncbi:MAG: hypothetical protein H6601_07050 [Flavobacteriales bacterium]|nr:hypothetical protein [Flavobacteriales bacterium]
MRTKCILVLLVLPFLALGQEEEIEHKEIDKSFNGYTIINSQSVDLMRKTRGFGVMIQHRFGTITPDKQAIMQFLGFDLPANIRFGFSYSFCKWFQLDIGRTKTAKMYDLGGKFRIMKQTTDNHLPLSISAYANVAINSDEFPKVSDREFFADSITPFKYRFEHRLYYSIQFMIARKFGNVASAQLSPILTYRNLAPALGSNLAFAIPISARFKVSKKGSILVEYAPVIVGRQRNDHLDPLSIGYEIATAGHVFQIVFSTSKEILENRLYAEPTERYDKGYFLLGFNIMRQIWIRPKRNKK